MKLPFSVAIRLWLVSQLLKQNIGVPGGEEFHPGTKFQHWCYLEDHFGGVFDDPSPYFLE